MHGSGSGPSVARLRGRVGSTVDGRYRLDGLLGHGAYGAVYRAHDAVAGSACAVKLFHYDGPGRAQALQRFVREVEVARRVRVGDTRHPNVVDILAVGRDEGADTCFIVEELLRGESLGEHLGRRPGRRVASACAVRLLAPAIDAVATAHARGVVHRDLKPDNIFLARDPARGVVPKVLDFGSAQLQDARITCARATLGTLAYLAPEAIGNSQGADPRVDVWALGVILYEMLAGAAPFGSSDGNPFEVYHAIVRSEPLALGLRGVSPGLGAVVARCLAKRPGDRYRDARALHDALRACA